MARRIRVCAFLLVLWATRYVVADPDARLATQRITSSHLSSEVARSDFKIQLTRHTQSPLGVVPANAISRTCHCILIDSPTAPRGKDANEKEPYKFTDRRVRLTMTFAKVPSTTKQSVIVLTDEQRVRFDWHCKIVKDVESSKSILRFDLASKAEDRQREVQLSFRSRRKFAESARPRLVFDAGVVKAVSLSDFKTSTMTDGFHQQQCKAVITLAKSIPEGSSRSVVQVVHPDLADKNPDQLEDWARYRSLLIPVYLDDSSTERLAVNFGAVRVGSDKEKTLPVKLSPTALASLVEQIEPPFEFVAEAPEASAPVRIRFRPEKGGRFAKEIHVELEDGKLGLITLKGLAYGKIVVE